MPRCRAAFCIPPTTADIPEKRLNANVAATRGVHLALKSETAVATPTITPAIQTTMAAQMIIVRTARRYECSLPVCCAWAKKRRAAVPSGASTT